MRATIDRIDNKIAVLITCGESPDRITLPATLLPEGSREGDIVTIAIGSDRDATARARERVAGLADRLSRKYS